MCEIEVIISRFKEDIVPLLELLVTTFHPALPKITVYNKGGDDLGALLQDKIKARRQLSKIIAPDTDRNENAHHRFQIVNLANLGREADTYLHHIVTHFKDMKDYYESAAIATHTDPDTDTTGTTADTATGTSKHLCVFLPASAMTDIKLTHTKKLLKNAIETQNTVLAGQWIQPSVRGRFGAFQIKKWQGSHEGNASDMPTVDCLPASRRPFSLWYDHFFPKIKTNIVCYYSMFAVSWEHILQGNKSLRYYEHLLNEVRTHSNPETGHFFERSWEAVFAPLPDACLVAARPAVVLGGAWSPSSNSANVAEMASMGMGELLKRYSSNGSDTSMSSITSLTSVTSNGSNCSLPIAMQSLQCQRSSSGGSWTGSWTGSGLAKEKDMRRGAPFSIVPVGFSLTPENYDGMTSSKSSSSTAKGHEHEHEHVHKRKKKETECS